MNLKVSNKSSEKLARGVSFWLKVMVTARWEAPKPMLNDLTVFPEGLGDGGEHGGWNRVLNHQVGQLEARFLGRVDSSAVFFYE